MQRGLDWDQKIPQNFELEMFEINKTRAAQVRSRVKLIYDWEKSSKLFLGLEKARANSKIMEQVYDDDRNILTNQHDIQNRQKKYFEDLYKKRIDENDMETKINDFTQDCNVPKLSEDQKVSCDRPLTENEVLLALKEMNNGSAPGCDGITIEFLKFV